MSAKTVDPAIQQARAARLAASRTRIGWSQQRLADAAGVNVKSVKRWEAAKPGYNVPDDVLEFVAMELDGMCIAARNAIIDAERTCGPVVIDCRVYRAGDSMSADEAAEHNAAERIKADYAECKGLRVCWRLA